jgi:hypothetical protein
MRRLVRFASTTVGVALALAAAAPAGDAADVVASPGGSVTYARAVAVPKLPPRLDLAFLVDATGSMGGEISNVRNGFATFLAAVRVDSPDSAFGVASFRDYPTAPYGDPAGTVGPLPSQPYYLNSDLSTTQSVAQNGLNSLTALGGNDLAEAHVTALYQLATGAGTTAGGASVASGSGISFRPGAAHVVALLTDAPAHGDKDGNDAYGFAGAPTYQAAVDALNAAHVTVIAAFAQDGTDDAAERGDSFAFATDTGGGTTVFLSDGTGLYDGLFGVSPGLLGALRALTYDVSTAAACKPLAVTVTPAGPYADVAGGTDLDLEEKIAVPARVHPSDLPAGGVVPCTLEVRWGDALVASYATSVQVRFPTTTTASVRRRASRIDVTGKVRPANRPVLTVRLSRRRGGRYVTLATKHPRLTTAKTFSASFRRPAPGRCKLEAIAPGSPEFAPSRASRFFAC